MMTTKENISTYKSKRNFKRTPEPDGVSKSRGKGRRLRFVVQRHDASTLHYDFRLEANGVLKSWAIPKGLSMTPSSRRLAIMVEAHPLSYADFEGTIPEGNYGAGKVKIWDQGWYQPSDLSPDDQESEISRHIRKGKLEFELRGRKLKGLFVLVRMKGPKRNQWLFIKRRDR